MSYNLRDRSLVNTSDELFFTKFEEKFLTMKDELIKEIRQEIRQEIMKEVNEIIDSQNGKINH